MGNDKTFCSNKVNDCSLGKSITKKWSSSQVAEDGLCKGVSFTNHGERSENFAPFWKKSQYECVQAFKAPPRSHCDGIEISTYKAGSMCEGTTGDALTGRTKKLDNNTSTFFKIVPTSDNTNSEEWSLQMISCTDLCPQFEPAVDVAWRGNFEVLDCGNFRVCEGISAHPSAKVAPMALDVCKKLTPVLSMKMHPREEICPEIFQNVPPKRGDIALYFYPRKPNQRAVKQYASLLEDMDKKDLLLRCCMHETELLIFSSTLMPEDSQRLGNDYFMWGVFRPVDQDHTSARKAGAQLSTKEAQEDWSFEAY